jgi:hypothetical protein
MQRERFSFFSGKFVPSPGDLVLSKTGEVLGVMANKEYCMLLNDLTASRFIQTGPISPGPLLTRMHEQIMRLPNKLQCRECGGGSRGAADRQVVVGRPRV